MCEEAVLCGRPQGGCCQLVLLCTQPPAPSTVTLATEEAGCLATRPYLPHPSSALGEFSPSRLTRLSVAPRFLRGHLQGSRQGPHGCHCISGQDGGKGALSLSPWVLLPLTAMGASGSQGGSEPTTLLSLCTPQCLVVSRGQRPGSSLLQFPCGHWPSTPHTPGLTSPAGRSLSVHWQPPRKEAGG